MVVMIFSMVAFVLPVKSEAAYSSYIETGDTKTQDEIKEIVNASLENNYPDAQAALEAELALGYLDYVSSAGNKYTLYVNRYNGCIYYVNNVTGEILTSNPYNPAIGYTQGSTLGQASPDVRKKLMSQIIIEFFETANSTIRQSYDSTTWAASYGQLSVTPIPNGLRVNYTLGDTTTRFLLPGQMTAAKFEERLFKPMVEYVNQMMETYVREFEPDAQFDFFANGETVTCLIKERDKKTGKEVFVLKTIDIYVDGCLSNQAIRDYFSSMSNYVSKYYDDGPRASAEERAIRKSLDKVNGDVQTFVNSYTVLNPQSSGVSEDTLKSWYERYPIIAEGVAVYYSKAKSVTEQRRFSTTVRTYVPEYTFNELYEDEEEVGFKATIPQKPVFRCALEYSFNSDGSLSVRLPANSINFDENVYTLQTITPLPYFGAGDLTEEGYVFVPDGSGAIVEFEDFYNSSEKQSITLTMGTYGKDYCYSNITGAHKEQVVMPVYGVVSKQSSTAVTEKISGKSQVDAGYFAILEEGASLANLFVSFGGVTNRWGTAYASFTPYPSDEYDLSDTISVGNMGAYTIVSESKYTGSYITRYVMLSDVQTAVLAGAEFTEASYTGMATYYREYLKDSGVLTKLEQTNKDLPLYIEALGSMEKLEKILTFPVMVDIPLTTFDNVIAMYDELADAKNKLLDKATEYDALAEAEEDDLTIKEKYEATAKRYRELAEQVSNITNINFKLTGFANGGMYFTYPVKVDWENTVGGRAGFESLLVAAKDRTKDGAVFGVYPEFDFMYINYTDLFDGISNKGNVSRMVDNRYASKKVYNSVTREYESFFTMIITPDALDRLYDIFIGKFSGYDVDGISVSTLGSDLNSNFDEDAPVNRDEAQGYVCDLLDRISADYSVMLSKGNIYSVKYADHILDMCIDSSHYAYSSYYVPFVGMILHSYVNYTGGAINYSGSSEYDLLHSIENGASLYYILCYQNSEFMKDDEDLSKYYGVNYDTWFDSIVESYSVLNDTVGALQSYEIVAHTTLLAERVIDAKELEANRARLTAEFLRLVDTQISAAIAAAFDEMYDDPASLGRGVKLTVDVDALIAQAVEILNYPSEELLATDFDEKLNEIVSAHTAAYPGKNVNSYLVEFNAVEYSTSYNYVTDSFAQDKDYKKTNYTVDNHQVTMVTYRDAVTGDEVKFILNYNIYAVTVALDSENTYTIPKYGFVRID